MTLYRDTVRGPRPGETAPYVRNADAADAGAAERGDDAAEAAGEDARGDVRRDRRRRGPGRVARSAALFGAPDGSGGFTPLHGDYRIEVRIAVADPTDTIAGVGAVVGGAVYGLAGTDTQGRDLMEGLLFGLPVALLIGISAAVVSTAIGTGLGLVSGFMGGRVDLVIQRTADIVNNVPLLPLLIFMVFVLGSQLWLILLVLVAFSLARA